MVKNYLDDLKKMSLMAKDRRNSDERAGNCGGEEEREARSFAVPEIFFFFIVV